MAATHYSELGLSEGASAAEIKQAFRRLALKWHPDKNADNREAAEERFKRIAEAYDVLSDATKRRQYDAELRDGPAHGYSGGGGGGWQPPPRCAECGGTCMPGACPFAGVSNPFATRWDTSFDRSNRRSAEGGAASSFHGPFGAFPEPQAVGGARRAHQRMHARAPAFSFGDAEEVRPSHCVPA